MVLIEAKVTGLQSARTTAANIAKLNKTLNKRVVRGVTRIPNTSFSTLSSLYKKSPTSMNSIQDEIQAGGADIVEEAVVFNTGLSHKRKLGSVRTRGLSVDTVIKKFRQQNNTIFIAIPSVSKTHVIAFIPKPNDLVVTKDNRGTNLYNVALTSKAIKKLSNEFSAQVSTLVEKQAKDLYNRIKTGSSSGLSIELSGKIGVAADLIHVMPTFSGIDLTEKVKAQVRRNMRKQTGLISYSRSLSTNKLTNRSNNDGFVGSINSVRIKDKTAIGYKYDSKTYGIHEKPLGSITTIVANHKYPLHFVNKKTGDEVYTRKVRIKSRPVIKRSIREVALKLFNRRFNVEQDN